jgi:hypothetical protein
MKNTDTAKRESIEELKELYTETVEKLNIKLEEYDKELTPATACITAHNWLFVVERTGGFLGDTKELCWIYKKDHFEHVSGVSPSLCGIPHYEKEAVTKDNLDALQRDVDKYVKREEMEEVYTVKAIGARDFKINQREETKRMLDNAEDILAKAEKYLSEEL